MIIGGLWFGEEKPNMRVFLKPIIAEPASRNSNKSNAWNPGH